MRSREDERREAGGGRKKEREERARHDTAPQSWKGCHCGKNEMPGHHSA